MRNVLKTLLIACVALFTFSGCNYHILNEEIDMEVIYIDAKRSGWQVYGKEGEEGCYQFQEFYFPEISSDVMLSGAVLVYMIDESGRDNILPLVLPYDDGRESVIETIRYDYEEDYLTLLIEASDFMAYLPKRDIRFKVCILN